MKHIILFSICLFFSINVWGQGGTQVDYSDNFGPITLSYTGLVNTKHSYQGTDAGATVTVQWSGTQWEIFINVGGAGDVLSFSSPEPTSSNPPNLTVGNWQDENGGDGTSLTGLSGTGTTSIVLPVELVGFHAINSNNSIILEWMTATEEENLGFEIQRSIDGSSYETIKFVEGNGTTYEAKKYQYTDNDLKGEQTYYYRLKQLDFNGDFEYSLVVNARLEANITQAFYPNPTNGMVTVKYNTSMAADLIIVVYNTIGQVVLTESRSIVEGSNQLNFDFTKLEKGNYFVKIQNGDNVQSQNLIIN